MRTLLAFVHNCLPFISTALNLKSDASKFWKKNKYYMIAAAVLLLFLLILCCYLCRKCRKSNAKKHKKGVERLKIKKPQPKKKLARIQPDKNEIKAMVNNLEICKGFKGIP